MTLQIVTTGDDTGFQSEHSDLLTKIATYKSSVVAMREGLKDAMQIQDADYRNKAILTLEAAKFQANLDYLQAQFALIEKIDETISFGSGDPQFVGAFVPDENEYENSSDVLLIYA